jgi:sulfide dehydrogenase cytochrome subunit
MTIHKVLAAIAIAALAASQAVSAAEAGGAIIAAQCNGCHGFEGASKGVIPALKSKPAPYLAQNMKDFRSDKKIGTVMNRIAKGYTDAEIDNVAQFYSELK